MTTKSNPKPNVKRMQAKLHRQLQQPDGSFVQWLAGIPGQLSASQLNELTPMAEKAIQGALKNLVNEKNPYARAMAIIKGICAQGKTIKSYKVDMARSLTKDAQGKKRRAFFVDGNFQGKVICRVYASEAPWYIEVFVRGRRNGKAADVERKYEIEDANDIKKYAKEIRARLARLLRD